MDFQEMLSHFGCSCSVKSATQFCTEEDGSAYQVWKLETDAGDFVLKKITQEEKAVYEAFFSQGGPAPKVFGFREFAGEWYLLMEYFAGSSMSRCTRQRLIRTLDALIESQKRYWNSAEHGDVGYSFEKSWPNRCKRLAYMGDLAPAYQAYLDTFASLPRTLCNDDLLPFNVLATEERAVILDWEYAGILPYPCALARFLAFGEERDDAMFFMTEEDRQFALDYYYAQLVQEMGISRAEFDGTMALFFFKEYSEWVYCAAISGEEDMEYAQKYGPMARKLAEDLGYL